MDYQEDISNARECYEAIRAGLQTKAQRGAGTKAGSTVYTELQYIVPYDKYLYIKDASHVETSKQGFFREKRLPLLLCKIEPRWFLVRLRLLD